MRCITPELQEIVEAVEFHSADSFSVFDEVFEMPPEHGGSISAHLANALYQRLYCRPQKEQFGRVGDSRASRVFIDELSRANCGSGTWEPGWVVKAVEDNGTLVVHKELYGVTLWAQPSQFRPIRDAIGIGCVGRLRLGKELREMLPGYYTVLGEADQSDDVTSSSVPVVRFYWHLTAEVSRNWIAELTQRFNCAGVAFHAKVQSHPRAYVRADAGVLYVAQTDLSRAMALLPDLHSAVSAGLRRATPMFTKRLGRGLAVAEDPGDGRSFGQHRCRLVAEGLVRGLEAGRTGLDDAASSVVAQFVEAGLSITRPWLNPGSRERYAWPPMRSRS
jgi:HopA1 effector protein family